MVLAFTAGYVRWDHNRHGCYFWASDKTLAEVAAAKKQSLKAAKEKSTAPTPAAAAPATP